MALDAAPFEWELFWEDLLAYIHKKRVIPVIGAELLTIHDSGRQVPLYRAVAERLLTRFRLWPPSSGAEILRERHELNDAVCVLAAAGFRVDDLYPRIHDILQKLLAELKQVPQPLLDLAAIRDFDLFVTTTPDNLLAQALNTLRYDGADVTHEIEYAPNLPSNRRQDIPEERAASYTAVFYLFGKADVSPCYAIHDEDALEFPYALQAGKGAHAERMFSELQGRNLLLIGCAFYDWLSRFFIRMSSPERLFSDHRMKKEFLVGEETAGDQSLTVFLKRFSHASRCYSTNACAFVAELRQRWQNLYAAAGKATPPPSQAAAPEIGLLGGSIFISYAHEDIVAARKLCGQIEEIGGEVAWFDKTALKPGDVWESQIRSAIERCNLFLPLLSATTEQRTEGYFRDEWTQAAERYRKIQGRKFIVPISLDAAFDGNIGRYVLVPQPFKDIQYGHAPAGLMSDELKASLIEQVRGLRRARFV
jgi:hypothetical protein